MEQVFKNILNSWENLNEKIIKAEEETELRKRGIPDKEHILSQEEINYINSNQFETNK